MSSQHGSSNMQEVRSWFLAQSEMTLSLRTSEKREGVMINPHGFKSSEVCKRGTNDPTKWRRLTSKHIILPLNESEYIQSIFFLNDVCQIAHLAKLYVMVKWLPNESINAYVFDFLWMKSFTFWCTNAIAKYTQIPKIPRAFTYETV